MARGARAEGGYGRSWALGGGAWEARRACRFSSRVIGRGVGGSVGSGGPAPSTVRLVARCCIAGLLLGSNGCLVCAGRNLCVSSVESAAGPRAECVCVCVGVGWSTMEYGVSEYHPTTPVSFRLRSQIPGFIQYGCTLCTERRVERGKHYGFNSKCICTQLKTKLF